MNDARSPLADAIEFSTQHEIGWTRDPHAEPDRWGVHGTDPVPWNRLLGPVHARGGVSGVIWQRGRPLAGVKHVSPSHKVHRRCRRRDRRRPPRGRLFDLIDLGHIVRVVGVVGIRGHAAALGRNEAGRLGQGTDAAGNTS